MVDSIGHRNMVAAHLGARTPSVDGAGINLPVDMHTPALHYLTDHAIHNRAVVPGAFYVELALATTTEVLGWTPLVLRGIQFPAPLCLEKHDKPAAQIQLKPGRGDEWQLTCFAHAGAHSTRQVATAFSTPTKSRVIHAQITLPVTNAWTLLPVLPNIAIGDIQNRASVALSATEVYRQLAQQGNHYGTAFQGIRQLWPCVGEALAQIRVPPMVAEHMIDYHLHPALLDACLQPLAFTLDPNRQTFMVTGIDEIRCYDVPSTSCWSHAQLTCQATTSTAESIGDVRVVSDFGDLLIELIDVRFRYNETSDQPSGRKNFCEPHKTYVSYVL